MLFHLEITIFYSKIVHDFTSNKSVGNINGFPEEKKDNLVFIIIYTIIDSHLRRRDYFTQFV